MANYRAMARAAAKRAGLDPDIFERQINAESGFRPDAQSPAGARGIAQIMPATAKGWGVNPDDPRAALNAAAQHMAQDVHKYGSYENALRAYNAGPAAIKASHGYAETNAYVKKILQGHDPGAGDSGGSSGPSAGPLFDTKTSKRLVSPAVDNQAARTSLVYNFLSPDRGHGKKNLLDFAAQAQQLKDVPAQYATDTVTSTSPASAAQSATSGTSAGLGDKHSGLLELIHKAPSGPGYAVKNGQVVSGPGVYGSVWDGHADHVHVAAGPETIVKLGKMAQKMGLKVGENPHFGGVSPVHVPGSYHYRGEAIDVSGDPHTMDKYAAAVERAYKLK